MLHIKDQRLLHKIKDHLGVGNIQKHSKSSVQYRITAIQDILKLIQFLQEFPLISQKRADLELFKQAIKLINLGEHLTEEGLIKLVAIRGSLNLGLTKVLKESFPNIKPVSRPIIEVPGIIDPH